VRPGQFRIDVCSQIGGRPRQEDRFFVRNDIHVAGEDIGFFGVWDGTVDQHASDFVHTRCCGHHLDSAGFREYCTLLENGDGGGDIGSALIRATEEGYAATDKEVIQSCRELRNHYSSCTSVTCMVASGLLTVGHLGDSRCYLLEHSGKNGQLRGSCLTDDHKPDDPEERLRIERSGGTIQLLTHHHNKPFIRGGDFDRRKATGERVMQLQYELHTLFSHLSLADPPFLFTTIILPPLFNSWCRFDI
jgi:serine/threonine protein phosphatase PrpC